MVPIVSNKSSTPRTKNLWEILENTELALR
jgi:hypothetical protein